MDGYETQTYFILPIKPQWRQFHYARHWKLVHYHNQTAISTETESGLNHYQNFTDTLRMNRAAVSMDAAYMVILAK